MHLEFDLVWFDWIYKYVYLLGSEFVNLFELEIS